MAGLSQCRCRGFISQLFFSVLLLSLIIYEDRSGQQRDNVAIFTVKNVRNYASQCIRKFMDVMNHKWFNPQVMVPWIQFYWLKTDLENIRDYSMV